MARCPLGALEYTLSGRTPTSAVNFDTPPWVLVIRSSLFLATTFSLVAALAQAQQPVRSGNPILAGWYADPEAHVFEGRYWIYPTYSAPYNQQTYLDAFSSRDLVAWTKHPRILDTANVSWAKRAVWAPSIIQKDGWYYLFFGANDIQSDAERGGIGVARARTPNGPFADYLGKPLVDRFHNGAQPIDQFVFKDKDGAHYLIYGGWRHCNIARLNDTFTGFVPFPDGTTFKEITPAGYVEGAFMFLKDDKYYFMWSEGGWTGPNYAVAYAVGTTPFGPFERVGKILQQDSTVATGAGHHSILHAPGSPNWYIVYHRRPLGETDRNHRVVSIDALRFDARGMIEPVVITKEGVAADVLPPLEGAHAHNDFVHPRPLRDALDRGFASVEADVHLVGGRLLVAHHKDSVDATRTLEGLYLAPLREYARQHGGRVQAGAQPFMLLIDVKSDSEATYVVLDSVLRSYGDILTRFEGKDVTEGAVTAVVSGNRAIGMMRSARVRYAGIDGRLSDLNASPRASAALFPIISDSWEKITKVKGDAPVSAEARRELARVVALAHRGGQRIRFWATPDTPAVWTLLSEAGVDVIGADDLDGLHAFLTRR